MKFIHIVAGSIGLITGFVALSAGKGGRVHRKSGMLFVFSMLVMTMFGAVIAALSGIWAIVNIPAAITTAYLVTTGVITVRRPAAWPRLANDALMMIALVLGATMLAFGINTVVNGGNSQNIPAFPFFLFGVTCLIGGIGDYRLMRIPPLQGSKRLARHLWRMSFALFIAAMSFFIGQAKVIPKAIRIYPLLALPVLAVLLTMFYWMWRVRRRGHNILGRPDQRGNNAYEIPGAPARDHGAQLL